MCRRELAEFVEELSEFGAELSGTCKPKRLGEGRKSEIAEEWLGETGANSGCTSAKRVLDGASSASETFAPWVQKTFCALS